MRPALVLAATSMLLSAAAATAQPTAAAAPAAPADAPEKKVCRRTDSPTGSIMGGKRVCHTRAEWQAIDRQRDGAGDSAMQQLRGAGAVSAGH